MTVTCDHNPFLAPESSRKTGDIAAWCIAELEHIHFKVKKLAGGRAHDSVGGVLA